MGCTARAHGHASGAACVTPTMVPPVGGDEEDEGAPLGCAAAAPAASAASARATRLSSSLAGDATNRCDASPIGSPPPPSAAAASPSHRRRSPIADFMKARMGGVPYSSPGCARMEEAYAKEYAYLRRKDAHAYLRPGGAMAVGADRRATWRQRRRGRRGRRIAPLEEEAPPSATLQIRRRCADPGERRAQRRRQREHIGRDVREALGGWRRSRRKVDTVVVVALAWRDRAARAAAAWRRRATR